MNCQEPVPWANERTGRGRDCGTGGSNLSLHEPDPCCPAVLTLHCRCFESCEKAPPMGKWSDCFSQTPALPLPAAAHRAALRCVVLERRLWSD